MYAIVDIETTGSYAANNGITELAIVLFDGNKIIDRFESLVNPQMPIPRYIQVLTGIHEGMTALAPLFSEIADRVHGLLKDAIFIAHNVNFDYSFIKFHLEAAGYSFQVKKLCTVRLSRKIFPGLPGYSLGKLCRELGIPLENRHRAGGDADATVRLFERILLRDSQGHVQHMLMGRSREQYLPPNLPEQQIATLPYTSGVYYFHDQKGKVIYVGKAKNLRNRVCSHFSNNHPGLRKQEFLRNIFSISWQESGTELMAFLFECVEIKRLWPKYNSSLKRFEQSFGLYAYVDRNGYMRLTIEKKKMHLHNYYSFNGIFEGRQLISRLVRQFRLCPKLCFLQQGDDPCDGIRDQYCDGACIQDEDPQPYNDRVEQALESLSKMLPSFVIRDKGRNATEDSYVVMENGRLYGMGYLDKEIQIANLQLLKEHLTTYPENDYMRGLVYQYAEKWPGKKLPFSTNDLLQLTVDS
jgi:DNA polymerase-3 subunit epsilon